MHTSHVCTLVSAHTQLCNILCRVKRNTPISLHPGLSAKGLSVLHFALSFSPEFPRAMTFLFQPGNSPTLLSSTHRLEAWAWAPASLCTWGELLPLSFLPHILQPRSQIGPRVPVGGLGVGAWGPVGVWTPASQPEKCCLDLHFILGSGQD